MQLAVPIKNGNATLRRDRRCVARIKIRGGTGRENGNIPRWKVERDENLGQLSVGGRRTYMVVRLKRSVSRTRCNYRNYGGNLVTSREGRDFSCSSEVIFRFRIIWVYIMRVIDIYMYYVFLMFVEFGNKCNIRFNLISYILYKYCIIIWKMVNRKVYNGCTSKLQKELPNLFQLIDDQEVYLYFFF